MKAWLRFAPWIVFFSVVFATPLSAVVVLDTLGEPSDSAWPVWRYYELPSKILRRQAIAVRFQVPEGQHVVATARLHTSPGYALPTNGFLWLQIHEDKDGLPGRRLDQVRYRGALSPWIDATFSGRRVLNSRQTYWLVARLRPVGAHGFGWMFSDVDGVFASNNGERLQKPWAVLNQDMPQVRIELMPKETTER